MSDSKRKEEREGGIALQERAQKKLARPRLYKVLFHNDDYTPRFFVVDVLIELFHHTHSAAEAIVEAVEKNGVGVAGIYTFEIAETKVTQVMQLAQKVEVPLLCTLEPDNEPPDESEQ